MKKLFDGCYVGTIEDFLENMDDLEHLEDSEESGESGDVYSHRVVLSESRYDEEVHHVIDVMKVLTNSFKTDEACSAVALFASLLKAFIFEEKGND